MNKLAEGVKIKAIYLTDGGIIKLDQCENITVSMEVGPMSLVPWAYVVKKDGNQLFNLSQCEGVQLC